MDYEERIAKLQQSIEKEEQQISKLQKSIRSKKAQIQELEDSKKLNALKTLEARGIRVSELVEAIQSNDLDTLFACMAKEDTAIEEQVHPDEPDTPVSTVYTQTVKEEKYE